jgi:hypothetical protein
MIRIGRRDGDFILEAKQPDTGGMRLASPDGNKPGAADGHDIGDAVP